MAGGYVVYDPSEVGELRSQLRKIQDRLSELEAPTGTQTAQAVAQIRTLVEDLVATVNALAASGVTWEGPVDTSGTVTADTGINSVGAYSNLLTTSFRALWVTNTGGTGAFGYVPSSAQFKQDIADAHLDPEVWRALRLVTFRYIAAVAELGDEAVTEWGLIAEEVHELGLTWLVDYDDDGKPFGVKRDMIALALIPAVQDLDARMTAAGL